MATGDTPPLVDMVFLEECFEKIKAMKESEEQCDVTLVVGIKEFRAHRIILGGASDYFCKLFDEKYAEGLQGRFVLNDCEVDSMSVVLDFIYSGILNVDDSNLAEILRLFDYFGIELAKEVCADYAIENVTSENCVETYILGDIYSLPEVSRSAKKTIISHLEVISGTEAFLELPIKHFENILMKSLGCHDKELLYRVVIRWVQYELPDRRKFLKNLLNAVEHEHVNVEFFVNHICKETILREDLESVNWVTSGLFKKCRETLVNHQSFDSVFIAERSLDDLSTYRFHFPTKTKCDWTPRPPVAYYSAAYYQNNICIAGGYTNERPEQLSNKSYKCSRGNGVWTEINFDCPKAYAGTCVLRDRWYVIGGLKDNPAFVYDFGSDRTVKISKLSGKRKLPGVVNYNGSLFICCGCIEKYDFYTGKSRFLNVVERYDPREGLLEAVYEFSKVRGMCTASVVTDYLFCLRSYNRDMERLDLRFYDSEIWPINGLQLNATLEPLKCFDSSILDLLPTKIIIFGKLDTYQPDVLRVSINGLHKWSPQFENHIWKYLGWDDWSDFTPCSVTCGKGVQQRFRRCLLDSPTNSDRANSDSDSIRGSLSSSSSSGSSSSSSTSSLNDRYRDSDQSSEIVESRRSRSERQQLEQLHSYNSHHRQHQQEYQYHNTRFDKSGRSNNRNHKKYMTSSKMKRKRKKKGKVLSTLSCEGYNIEQRNCNMFECRDDISDLLKFYKKPLTFNDSMLSTMVSTTSIPAYSSSSTGSTPQPSTTNGHYPNKWKNPMNFTLMATLRAKSKAHLTIFSVRNFTHNMYLEQSLDGLKLFQERDDVTEMLPIKLDLYDNRWHQIAISVHNGDFITIHVDCFWTNSFVVSKGLFSLPDGADVEVGRNYNGDLLQLLLIPGNHDKLQCSTVRTSINEVKRYIIDTFIDDEDSN